MKYTDMVILEQIQKSIRPMIKWLILYKSDGKETKVYLKLLLIFHFIHRDIYKFQCKN